MNSKAFSSNSVPEATGRAAAGGMRATWDVTWRILVVATGYMLTSSLAAVILDRTFEIGAIGISLLSGGLIGVTLGSVAAQVRASRLNHWIAWGAVVFLNTLSVAIEGSFFAPTLSPMASMPVVWTAYLGFESAVSAGLVAVLFGQTADETTSNPPRHRTWYSWAWRFVVSSFSYLVFYFIFGALNYALVTRPYYAAHVSGLAVPAPQTVLMAEMVRAPLIVLSVIPLILLWRGRKLTLAVVCGIILFVIGGVVPLLLNTALPDLLRCASAIEIFFQNFSTGLVAAGLLGFRGAEVTRDR